jgi:hypothetical protein
MKIRNGFVSNSSSSSFIIALEKKPESKEEVKEIFFPNKRLTSLVDKESTYNVSEAVNDIWLQIKFWDENLCNYYVNSEMKSRLYNESKSNELNYYGTDENLFKEYKEISKKYYRLISSSVERTKGRELLYKQKCKRFDSEMEILSNRLWSKDIEKFFADGFKKNKCYIFVLEFSTEGIFWSPLEWTSRWLKYIHHIKISKH